MSGSSQGCKLNKSYLWPTPGFNVAEEGLELHERCETAPAIRVFAIKKKSKVLKHQVVRLRFAYLQVPGECHDGEFEAEATCRGVGLPAWKNLLPCPFVNWKSLTGAAGGFDGVYRTPGKDIKYGTLFAVSISQSILISFSHSLKAQTHHLRWH